MPFPGPRAQYRASSASSALIACTMLFTRTLALTALHVSLLLSDHRGGPAPRLRARRRRCGRSDCECFTTWGGGWVEGGNERLKLLVF